MSTTSIWKLQDLGSMMTLFSGAIAINNARHIRKRSAISCYLQHGILLDTKIVGKKRIKGMFNVANMYQILVLAV